jgi:hypothetical protein
LSRFSGREADGLVEWTSIPVKLKILKLFIRELSNITEGEENRSDSEDQPATGSTKGGWETVEVDNADDWESDESDEEWEDDDASRGVEVFVEDTQEDLLKGVNTKVRCISPFVIWVEDGLMIEFYCGLFEEG